MSETGYATVCLALTALTGLLVHGAASAQLTVQDDLGRSITLRGPAQRVVSAAPHATELVVAAGGAAHLVGVDRYSDYPSQVTALPKVGDGLNLNIEQVLTLKPDLVIFWAPGNTPGKQDQQLQTRLQAFGIAVYYSSPRRLTDIPPAVGRLGQALGTQTAADAAARDLRQTLGQLQQRYAGQRPLRTFYQLGSLPMYTVNHRSIISDALSVCGAINIFAGLPMNAPLVSAESVLLANPQAIVAPHSGSGEAPELHAWRAYASGLSAARHHNLITVDADRMNRPGPRMIDETGKLCAALEQARGRTP